MAKLIHSMIRVFEPQQSLRFYEDCFGLKPVHTLDFPDFRLIYLRNPENDSEIELTWNKDRKTPYTHGDGYGHVAVCVDNTASERTRLLSLGYQPGDIKEFKDAEGNLIARYFFIQDPDGYKIEVLERHGHYQ